MPLAIPQPVRKMFWRPVFAYHMIMGRWFMWRLRKVPSPLIEHGSPEENGLCIRSLNHMLKAGDALMLSARPAPGADGMTADGGGK